MNLEEEIEALFAQENPPRNDETLQLLERFRQALNRGEIRVASPRGVQWEVNVWVKKGILLHVVLGQIQSLDGTGGDHFMELDTFPRRTFQTTDRVRVPKGCYVRDGAYLAPGVTCMPPVFINMGANIGTQTVLDSHVMVGLCAQVGSNVHISSGAQIGGIIDPPEKLPTIIENDVIIGGNCSLYDGVHIGSGAMLASGTNINSQTRVYDLVRKQAYRFYTDQPLSIPPLAIVVPGSRAVTAGLPGLAGQIHIQTPVVIAYRDNPSLPEDLLGMYLD